MGNVLMGGDLYEGQDPSTALSVSSLNEAVKHMIHAACPPVWVQGEVSNTARPRSGHVYFSLKDTHAQLACVRFKPRTPHAAHDSALADGAHITAHGRVTLYPPRGSYQFVVDQWFHTGEGSLELAFQALKRSLQAEGLFDRTVPPPSCPRHVAVITSATGAAWHDVQHVLRQRFPLIPVRLYPAIVQGEHAVPSLLQALQAVIDEGVCDVLLLVRGGGSLEDLWAFNDARLARALFACPVPIVTGIGHETDTTIADWVADQRTPTPSAAAAYVTPDATTTRATLRDQRHTMHQRVQARLQREHERLHHTVRGLRSPRETLQHAAQTLDLQTQALHHAWTTRMTQHHHAWSQCHHQLLALNPEAVLERGYAIVRQTHNAQPVSSPDQVQPGDRLMLQLARGTLHTQVIQPTTDDTPTPDA